MPVHTEYQPVTESQSTVYIIQREFCKGREFFPEETFFPEKVCICPQLLDPGTMQVFRGAELRERFFSQFQDELRKLDNVTDLW